MNVANERRRRLAFVYHPFSFPTMAVVNAARGVCELVWVLDTSVPEAELMSHLLRRLGAVIDVAGLSLKDAAGAVAATRPDGILALRDSQLEWTACLAVALGLPFMTPQVAERLSDKYVQRRALEAAGLPGPGYWLVPGADDLVGWTKLEAQARFPALVKPRRGGGSEDVLGVESLDRLRARLGAIAQADGSTSRELLLEEYLPDRPADRDQDFAGYVSVESIVSDATISHLAITGRFPPAEPFRETGFFIPSALNPEEHAAVLELATKAINALDISLGCLHVEIKLTPDGPRVIELNGRMGGGTPAMLAAVSDFDLLAVAMRLALGEHVVLEAMPSLPRVVFVLYSHAPQSVRRIVAVEGLERLRGDPEIGRVILNRGPGQAVDWREGNWGHVFSVHGTVADHESLKRLARRVYGETRIRGE